MRDKRFVAEHRGGPLAKKQHRQLMVWACGCAKHVLYLFGKETDKRLTHALEVAEEWVNGNVKTGMVQKASVAALAVSREQEDTVAVAVARAVGQAVATAHMADHSLGAAWYALKAVKAAGKPEDDERKWQDEQLPEEIKELVLSAREDRNI